MPLTKLDENVALVVIDLQKGIAQFPTLRPLEEVIERVNQLSEAFRRKQLPVILVCAAGGSPGRTESPTRHVELPPDFTDLIPSLSQEANDHKIIKHTRGAFTHTDLEQFLQAKCITQVVITGVSTSNGVESTARQAYELGFNVALPTDAMTDGNADSENYSLTRVFPKLAELGVTKDIVGLLDLRSPSSAT